jgi:hypothetical protein
LILCFKTLLLGSCKGFTLLSVQLWVAQNWQMDPVSSSIEWLQLIPVNAVASAASGANSENSAWLQGQSGFNNVIVSSNNYFYSLEYLNKLNSTASFIQSALPVINGIPTSATDIFKNAYTSK